MPGQPVDSSPLHLHGRKEVAGGSKEQLKDRLRAKLVGEASQSAAVTKEEELQWWDEFTPEEQAEMRLLAMKALQEWVETNDLQGEEWAESLAARGSRESGKEDTAAIGEDGEAACNPLQRAQVLALCRAFNESELQRDGTQDVAEALSNSALLPQPKVTSGLFNSLKVEAQKASAEALAREAHLEVKEQKEQRVGRGHWFTRKFGTFDARIKGLILLNLLTFLYGKFSDLLSNAVHPPWFNSTSACMLCRGVFSQVQPFAMDMGEWNISPSSSSFYSQHRMSLRVLFSNPGGNIFDQGDNVLKFVFLHVLCFCHA
jgi:hypothetical protein